MRTNDPPTLNLASVDVSRRDGAARRRNPPPIRRARWALAAGIAAAGIGSASTARAVSSAEFYTPESYGYGRFEARLMFPAGDGVVGSFFLWKNGSEMAGTYWNELDYEKINANCSLPINSFYGLPAVQHQKIVSGVSNPCGSYHTYAFEWTPDHIAWSIDGKEVRRDTGASAQAYSDNALATGMQFRFSIWPGDSSFGGNFLPSILPVQEYISWVQYSTYTPGTGDVACNFTLAWRESFDQGVPVAWAEGNWQSPKMLSTNTASNVTVTNGIAVISLTADDMLGYTGTPPADDGDLPSVQPSDGGVTATDAAPVECDAGSSDDAGANGSSTSGSTSSGHSSGSSGGCSTVQRGAGTGAGPAVAAMLAIVAAFRRRRGPQRQRRVS